MNWILALMFVSPVGIGLGVLIGRVCWRTLHVDVKCPKCNFKHRWFL